MTLFWQHFRAQLTGLLIWIGVGALLSFSLSDAAQAFAGEASLGKLLESMPPAMKAAVGLPQGMSSLDGYMAIKWAAIPQLMLALYAVMLALSVVSREVDRRTIDFLLSLPVQRWQVLVARTAVMAVNTALLGVTIWVAMRLEFNRINLVGSFGGYGLVLLADWLVAMALGSLALLSSIWLDDYSLAVKSWLGLVSAAYFMELILKALELTRWERAVSPFSYADAVRLIQDGSLTWGEVAILLIVITAATGLSVAAFRRKQIVV